MDISAFFLYLYRVTAEYNLKAGVYKGSLFKSIKFKHMQTAIVRFKEGVHGYFYQKIQLNALPIETPNHTAKTLSNTLINIFEIA